MSHISIFERIKEFVPDHIVRDYPDFITFLSAYFEWVEGQDNPVGYIRSIQDNISLSNSIDSFVDDFKAEIIPQIPLDAVSDKRLYLKFIDDIKSTKGSEESFRLLFRILYGEDIELYYPKEDILRVSDGKWIRDEVYLFVTDTGNNLSDYESSLISQTRDLGGGNIEYADGTINEIRIYNTQNYKYIRLSITDITGEFKYGWPVMIANQYMEYVYPTVDTVNIDTPGADYVSNDAINWPVGQFFEITGTINVNKKTDLFITTTLDKTDLYVEVDSVDIIQDFEFDGRKLSLDNYSSGQSVLVRLPCVTGTGVISSVGVSGEILTTKIIEAPIGYNVSHSLTISSTNGSGGVVSSNSNDSLSVPGRYKNNDGHLSSDKYLQDGDFYQEYSYVIRVSESLVKYADTVKSLIHPAGMKLFGEISIFDLLVLSLSIEDFSETSFTVNILDHSTPLGPVLGSVEYFKDYYKSSSYPLVYFDDMLPTDVEDNYTKSVNFEAPPLVQFYFDGVEVDTTVAAIDDLYDVVMIYMPNHVDEYEVVNPVWPWP